MKKRLGFASPVFGPEVVERADLDAGGVGDERSEHERRRDDRGDRDHVGPLVGLERIEGVPCGLVLRLGPRGARLALRRELRVALARALLALAPLGALSLT